MTAASVRVDAMAQGSIAGIGDEASASERVGFAGYWVSETKHDPFMSALAASIATSRCGIGTAVAIAFARSPMTVAVAANDLAMASRGRFILGLGTQVKAHIERRFSMPWSSPAARMREFVLAMRAIWNAWEDGSRLEFEGSFYRHTLMSPFFTPERHEFGVPPVYLAGVGVELTRTAGEVCDGFLWHPFTTRKYIDNVTRPALRSGALAAGRRPQDVAVTGSVFVAVGEDDHALSKSIELVRDRIAFYGSTASYSGVLAQHGWESIQPELAALSRAGRWSDMASLVTDEMVHEFAVVGSAAEVGRGIAARYSDVADRVQLYPMHPLSAEISSALIKAAAGG